MNAATKKKLVIGGGLLLLLGAAFYTRKASAAELKTTPAKASQVAVTPGSNQPANFFSKALDTLFGGGGGGTVDTVTPATNAPDTSGVSDNSGDVIGSIVDAISNVFNSPPATPEVTPTPAAPAPAPAPAIVPQHTNVDAATAEAYAQTAQLYANPELITAPTPVLIEVGGQPTQAIALPGYSDPATPTSVGTSTGGAVYQPSAAQATADAGGNVDYAIQQQWLNLAMGGYYNG